jgi:hypothetical protein
VSFLSYRVGQSVAALMSLTGGRNQQNHEEKVTAE